MYMYTTHKIDDDTYTCTYIREKLNSQDATQILNAAQYTNLHTEDKLLKADDLVDLSYVRVGWRVTGCVL